MPANTPQIRKAAIEDAPAIARVHVTSWQKAYAHLFPSKYLEQISVWEKTEMWEKSIEQDVAHTLVARYNKQIIGFISIGPERHINNSSSNLEVWAFYVLPEHWSTWVGQSLWKEAQKILVAQGTPKISLWVFDNNPRAKRFYEAAGCTPELNSVQQFELDGVILEEIRYTQHLD
ncbi:GNAT family N-acetyltransferase [Acidithiobacillus montserratensis]|uniref:GNAT family N-acetyltransferase n=1 Tax=Acidithiobacillus montserratensis TaxID=2729135 RepID=A0ACD5HEQ1_9PROT|nr:GNAT family N-acetyltransferase [Acidithiobacillus montserratensis]MBU2747955.1 GNAT family N-acetyltransferase [Acidithiobacillus montserratensis]